MWTPSLFPSLQNNTHFTLVIFKIHRWFLEALPPTVYIMYLTHDLYWTDCSSPRCSTYTHLQVFGQDISTSRNVHHFIAIPIQSYSYFRHDWKPTPPQTYFLHPSSYHSTVHNRTLLVPRFSDVVYVSLLWNNSSCVTTACSYNNFRTRIYVH